MDKIAPDTTPGLLTAGDPTPVIVEHADAPSALVIVCDHAGNAIPRALGTLGLAPAELTRHIAIDVGALDLSRRLAARLKAPLIAQAYSRLVIDCNRAPGAPSSIAEISEATPVPGNRGLDAAQGAARARAIFDPYHAAIRALLDARAARPCVLLALHSFTPVFHGVARPWHVGVLYNRDRRVAEPLFAAFAAEPDLVVGDNEPYAVSDETDYTIPVHGERRGIPHVEIEVRQDLLASPAGRDEWAERLARAFAAALPGVL